MIYAGIASSRATQPLELIRDFGCYDLAIFNGAGAQMLIEGGTITHGILDSDDAPIGYLCVEPGSELDDDFWSWFTRVHPPASAYSIVEKGTDAVQRRLN